MNSEGYTDTLLASLHGRPFSRTRRVASSDAGGRSLPRRTRFRRRQVQPAEFPRLATEVETAAFRIVQEALTNVFRHSEAKKVWITLSQKDEKIVVAVRDDGKGIGKRIAELQPDSVGVGIGGMKQRAREFGGELRLTNVHPGTLVELMIPTSSVLREHNGVLTP